MYQITMTLSQLGARLPNDISLSDWLFDNCIFDFKGYTEDYIKSAIIDFYLDWQIGQETPSAFRRAFQRRLRWLIPNTRQLFDQLTYDIFSTKQSDSYSDNEMEQIGKSDNKNTGKVESLNQGDSRNSATPSASNMSADAMTMGVDGIVLNKEEMDLKSVDESAGNTQANTTSHSSSAQTERDGLEWVVAKKYQLEHVNYLKVFIVELRGSFIP